MKFKVYICLLYLFESGVGQNLSELEMRCFYINPPVSSKTNYSFVELGANDIENLLNVLFFIYKNFFSSYDIGECSFVPSCSEYMVRAIKKYGVLVGYLNGIDRLSRCNSLHPEKYSIDTNAMKFYDPPVDPLFEKEIF